MRLSEIDYHLDEAMVLHFKFVYKFIQEFLPTEYIVIEKIHSDKFKVHLELSSTTNFPEYLDRQDFTRKLSTHELIFFQNYEGWTNYKDLKTGGCTCGMWISPHSGTHESWCKKQTKYNWEK